MSHCPCPLKEAARDAWAAPFLILQNKTLSFFDVDQQVKTWCHFLQNKGVQEGDRIAISFQEKEKIFSLLLAAFRLQISLCPLNPALSQIMVSSLLEKISPKLFLSSTQERSFPQSFQTPSSLLLFTSGSSGTPKLAALSLDNLISNAAATLEPLQITSSSRYLASLPLYHVGGLAIFFRALLARASVTFTMEDPDITHLSYVWAQLYQRPPNYKKLQCLLLGGGPVGALPSHLPIVLSYGMTEMGSLITAIKNPPLHQNCYSAGFPLQGRELQVDSSGEILVKGPCLFQGYLEGSQLRLPLKQGWFPTKDLASWNPKQGLFLLGRKDRMFISGGENIHPEEIEKELMLLPYILEALVLAKKNPRFGYRPIAFIKLKNPTISQQTIRSDLLEKLPKFKIPDFFYILENFPKKGLKIDREKLEKLFP